MDINANKKERHLPHAFSLVGTNSLPVIDNQGGIGSCASQAVTRNQFSNAVTRYAHEVYPDCDKSYVFAPRFTYNFSGAGTAWVYETLRDHGCLTESECMFEKNSTGASMREKEGKICEKSFAWPVKKGEMKKALKNRVTSFEQIWSVKEPYNEQLTNTDVGRELLVKIKKALIAGNAVVTGGYPGRWVYGDVVNTGAYGKCGSKAVVASAGTSGGGHQVTIVGYDDDVTADFAGVRIKGAFIIANSYGDKWINDGYTYLMYDAVNTVSEYEKMNDSALYSGQMFFTFGEKYAMYSDKLAKTSQKLDFIPSGKTEKTPAGEFAVYYIKDKTSGKYIGYKAEKDERELTKTDEASKTSGFCFIPYEKLKKFPSFDADAKKNKDNKSVYDKAYEGSYWVYATGRECESDGYRFLDAGVGFSANGRSVNFATFNGGKYPVAKSWTLDAKPEGEFISRLGIAAGKDGVNQRIWSLDQFCFTDYEKDIEFGLPELYVELELEASDRESFSITMTRTDKNGKTESYMPALFKYGKSGCHPSYGKKEDYLTFSGKVNGKPETGYFTLAFSELLKIEKGKTTGDYKWGFIIEPKKNESVSLKKAGLYYGGTETLIYECKCDKEISKKAKFTF